MNTVNFLFKKKKNKTTKMPKNLEDMTKVKFRENLTIFVR